MNTEHPPQPKKKFRISIPFVIIGLLLIAMIVPVLEDIDNDNSRDSVSKYLLMQVYSAEEGAKSGGEAVKGTIKSGEFGAGGLKGASADMGGADKKEEEKED